MVSRFTPIGAHVRNATLSAVTPIAIPANANAVIVQALDQNIRFTLDGATSPTTTHGFQLKAGDPAVKIPVQGNTVLRVLQETATATLQYQFIQDYEL